MLRRGSVRLKNVILSAVRTGRIPCATVGEYLLAYPESAARFLRLPSMGIKSCDELTRLVENASSRLEDANETAGTIDTAIVLRRDAEYTGAKRPAFDGLRELLVINPDHGAVQARGRDPAISAWADSFHSDDPPHPRWL